MLTGLYGRTSLNLERPNAAYFFPATLDALVFRTASKS